MKKNDRLRGIGFRLLTLLLVLTALEGIGYLGLWLNSRSDDFFSNRNYFNIRHMLMDSTDPEHFPRYLSLPNMGYVPYPGYKKNGVVQHNADGYRGAGVPLQKTGKYRILCLGGSTTYGSGVDLPSQTYPARLQALAEEYVKQDALLRKKYRGVEVMNAGVEAGNSADELKQYLFKYRYYRPDMVIVHSGINDALLAAGNSPDFQLDYTHGQRLNFHLEPLTAPGRWFMRSYLFSFLSIRFFYEKFSLNGIAVKVPEHTFPRWSHMDMDSISAAGNLGYYPFYQNSESLYREILADSAVLLVLPNVLNPNSPMVQKDDRYLYFSALNDSLSKMLSARMNVVYVPFRYESITKPQSWLDDCHLDAQGEEEKVKVLWQYVREEMNK